MRMERCQLWCSSQKSLYISFAIRFKIFFVQVITDILDVKSIFGVLKNKPWFSRLIISFQDFSFRVFFSPRCAVEFNGTTNSKLLTGDILNDLP